MSGRAGLAPALVRGTAAVVGVQVLTAVANLLLEVALARGLGAEGYGTYVFAYRWMLLAMIFGRLGLDAAGLRFIARSRARGERPAAFVRFSSRATLVASTLVAGAGAAVVHLLTDGAATVVGMTLLVACIALPLSSLIAVWTAALRALGRVASALLPGDTLRPALLTVGLVSVLLLDLPLTAVGAMGLNVVATLATATLCGLLLRADMASAAAEPDAERQRTEWLRTSLPLAALALAHLLSDRADILFLGSLSDPGEVALYAAAKRLSLLITFGVRAVDTWVAPRVAGLHGSGDRQSLRQLLQRGASLTLAMTAPLATAALVWGRSLLSLWGDGFEAAYPALLILAASQLVTALFGPVATLLTMTGHHMRALRLTAASALLNAALCVTLIPTYGFVGAALATATVRICLVLGFAFVAWRRLGVRATVL